MWIYSWCSSRDIHGQNHLTEVFFVSRCGSTLGALQETYMFNLTAHFSYVCSEVTRHDQTHFTLQWIVQSVWSLEFLWADVDLLLVLFKRHTCSISLHTSVKCAVRSPDMIKLTSHFKISVQCLITWFFCEQMWIYFCCSSRDIHVQTHCTLKVIVQRVWSLEILWADVDLLLRPFKR